MEKELHILRCHKLKKNFFFRNLEFCILGTSPCLMLEKDPKISINNYKRQFSDKYPLHKFFVTSICSQCKLRRKLMERLFLFAHFFSWFRKLLTGWIKCQSKSIIWRWECQWTAINLSGRNKVVTGDNHPFRKMWGLPWHFKEIATCSYRWMPQVMKR